MISLAESHGAFCANLPVQQDNVNITQGEFPP